MSVNYSKLCQSELSVTGKYILCKHYNKMYVEITNSAGIEVTIKILLLCIMNKLAVLCN